MPWHLSDTQSGCSGWAVVKDSDSSTAGCHPTQAEAKKHMAALYANEPAAADAGPRDRPPRDSLVRAQPGDFELAATETGTGPGTMVGHFAVFDQWTEINSIYEGNFMERIAPGAFAYSFKTNRTAIRSLFQHGKDPQVGEKPLGPITALEEDDYGARYEVTMLDTSYNRDIAAGLKEGLYGSSFRFSVQKDRLDAKPRKSATNPDGLPERTIQEAWVHEFGPVTFPAYAGATAGMRSITDEYLVMRLAQDPNLLRELLTLLRPDAVTDERPAVEPQSVEVTSVVQATVQRRFPTREDYLQWVRKSLI